MSEAATTSIWALIGIVTKLIDDFVMDNDLLESKPFLKTLLIGAIFVFYTIGTFDNINTMIILVISFIIGSIIKPADYAHPIILSLFCLIPFVILYSYIYTNQHISFKTPSLIDIGFVLIFIVSIIIESITIRSEVSLLKMVGRSIFLLVSIAIYLLRNKYNISESIVNISIYCGGYFFISVIFQAYALYNGLNLEKEEKTNAEKYMENLLGKIIL